jgi:hypothetical protein
MIGEQKKSYACFREAFTDVSDKATILVCTKNPMAHNKKVANLYPILSQMWRK